MQCAAGYVGECNRMRRSRQSRIVACRAYRVTEVAGLGVVKDGSEAVLKQLIKNNDAFLDGSRSHRSLSQ